LRPPIDASKALEDAEAMDLHDDGLDEGLWEIDEVMGSSCDSCGAVKYLTKWKGYPEPEDWTEEPFKHFWGTGEQALRRFHRKYPEAAKDRRIR
jgi:hypothetical protein